MSIFQTSIQSQNIHIRAKHIHFFRYESYRMTHAGIILKDSLETICRGSLTHLPWKIGREWATQRNWGVFQNCFKVWLRREMSLTELLFQYWEPGQWKITNLPLERRRSPFSLKFICVKRLSNFMTRPPSNLKFKQKSSLITVILFGQHNCTKIKKNYTWSQNFYLTDLSLDFVSKF